MRADGNRNRQALLDSARELFEQRRGEVPMRAIADRAGVGVGTLYRHFPTREALVAAVYVRDIAQLGEIDVLLAEGDAATALDRWLARFIAFSRTKRAIYDLLHEQDGAGSTPVPTSRGTIVSALEGILAAGRADGSLRADADAEDVLRAMSGIWFDREQPDWEPRVRRLGRLIVDGLRTRELP